MSWEYAPAVDAGQRAALAAGKAVLHVCPPAGWMLVPLVQAVAEASGTPQLLVVVGTHAVAEDVADALDTLETVRPVHAVTGLARSDRRLRTAPPATLIGTPPDLIDLLRRSALKAADVRTVLVAWPEDLPALGLAESLDMLLHETKAAARALATRDDAMIRDVIERHAHRAPLGVMARLPDQPLGPARYAVVSGSRRLPALRDALDQLNPASALLWEPLPARRSRWEAAARGLALPVTSTLPPEPARPTELAIATDFPTPEAFAALREAADEVLVLVHAHQVPALRGLAAPLRAVRLSGDVDRARDRAFRLRRAVRARLEAGALDGELLALAPLFDEHDPALVAAAALALADAPAGEPPAGAGGEEIPAWTRLHLQVGRRDGARAGDIVGALLNSAGLAKDRVGRVDIRDAFSLVEVRADDATAALRGLAGVRLRGRPVAARLDRR